MKFPWILEDSKRTTIINNLQLHGIPILWIVLFLHTNTIIIQVYAVMIIIPVIRLFYMSRLNPQERYTIWTTTMAFFMGMVVLYTAMVFGEIAMTPGIPRLGIGVAALVLQITILQKSQYAFGLLGSIALTIDGAMSI